MPEQAQVQRPPEQPPIPRTDQLKQDMVAVRERLKETRDVHGGVVFGEKYQETDGGDGEVVILPEPLVDTAENTHTYLAATPLGFRGIVFDTSGGLSAQEEKLQAHIRDVDVSGGKAFTPGFRIGFAHLSHGSESIRTVDTAGGREFTTENETSQGKIRYIGEEMVTKTYDLNVEKRGKGITNEEDREIEEQIWSASALMQRLDSSSQ